MSRFDEGDAPDERTEAEKREAEKRAREVAQRFAEMQARRAAEQQAAKEEAERKREADERARREYERAEEEARQNRRREEEERRRFEQEEKERRWQEEEIRAREETEKARAEVTAAARVLREARAKERAALQARWAVEEDAAEEAAREPRPRAPRSRVRRGAIVLFLVLVGGLLAITFMPLDAPSFEKAATAQFGIPVKIGSAHLSFEPLPALRFERVAIGPGGEVKIASVKANAGLGTILQGKKSFKSLELEGATVPLSWLAAAVWGKARSDALRVERVIGHGLKIQAEGLLLPAVNVDARLDAGGTLQSLVAETPDRTQSFNISMKDGRATVDLWSKLFRLPFPGVMELDDFAGKGTLTPSELDLREFSGHALGGTFNGNARLRWGVSWSLDGEFAALSVDPARVAAALVPTGRLAGYGTFSMRAPTPAKLQETLRVDGSFTVNRGTLGFVDLTRVLQGSRVAEGTTLFSTMAGNVSISGGTVRVRQLRLDAGVLSATGETSVDPQQKLNGRLQLTMGSQMRTAMSLGGTPSAPQIGR